MKYLCLIYDDEKKMSEMSKAPYSSTDSGATSK